MTPLAGRDGLTIYAWGAGAPLFLMPYPHAAVVVGDPTLTALISDLAALGRRVGAFDPPGAGRSMRAMRLGVPELLGCTQEALAAAGAAGPVELVGHRQGSLAALACAVERPALVRRLVLICTAARGPAYLHAPGAIWQRGHPDYWRMDLPAALFWVTHRRAPETPMLNAIFRASYTNRARFTPAPVAWRDWLWPGRPRLWWNQLARHLDFRDRLGEVRVPALVLAARLRRGVGPEPPRRLPRRLRAQWALSFP